MKRIVILGSTGSIGRQTLDIVRAYPNEFMVLGLAAHTNTELFEAHVREFNPKYALQTGAGNMKEGEAEKELCEMARVPDADLIVNAISGYAGLAPTYAACMAGKTIALANKESLVMAGPLIIGAAKKSGARILPIDSEPAAIWEIFNWKNSTIDQSALDLSRVKKITLTASGGPFWGLPREKLSAVTPAQATAHPTWDMGKKISVDSATLMNKAFEIIETHTLFEVAPEKIDVTIHRQSMVHGMVTWNDGTLSRVASVPDMKIPIAHALFYPNPSHVLPNNNFSYADLTFEDPDYSILKGPRLAYDVIHEGGILPAVFCMANDQAVGQFLAGEIGFLQIYDRIDHALFTAKNATLSLEAIHELHRTYFGGGEK